ncbi:MAG: hypothetical protein E7293_06080 [Lachnospiraceae bacterium]|nr:hypothetical protein [Lachnospiraceae bacterium]
MTDKKDIIIENRLCRLIVGGDAIVKSLLIKKSGEECLQQGEDIALFSVTQERPYNNEVKLAHPNKRTVFQANELTREGDRLIVGFEITPYKAVVEVKEAAAYLAFELVDFIVTPECYGTYLSFTPPPAAAFRLVQLPVKNREYFGEWLNVSWDESAAVNVLATLPYATIESERRKGYRVMTADAVKGIKLRGCSAAIIAAPTGQLMDAIAEMEEDYGLPHGVKSRNDFPNINSSIYWTHDLSPQTVDEHIAYAKKGGFRMMLIYYTCLVKEPENCALGDYDYLPVYPNGQKDLREMLDRIKAAGITPGIHILQTHIGFGSRYMTPSVDPRINLTRHFTLAKPLTREDTTVYVLQNPEDTVMHPKCRYLNFGGELIYYEAYTTQPPYCFTGCERGAKHTNVVEHPAGQIGGILDVSEFGAISAYIDQNTDLQDEVAEKIADLYHAGFEFIYFDGSEGTNVPHAIHVPGAQYKILKKLEREPLFTEGAAKAHFSWHFLSGGNAFDIFTPDVFKACIDKYPAEEAPRMRQDFTRLNFGWWGYYVPGTKDGGYTGTQPDMFEYGTSRAAAWDCPVTIQMKLEAFKDNPRTDDILEVMRRWEDVRRKDWLTLEQKNMLKELGKEHILLINEQGEYELVPYEQISCEDVNLRAFVFERKGKNYVVFWHVTGSGKLALDLDAEDFTIEKELGGEQVDVQMAEGKVVLPIAGRCYLKSSLTRQELIKAFEEAKIL